MFDCLNGRRLVHRLQVHGDYQAGIHVQEICQHPIGNVRGSNGKKRHGPVQIPHLESPSFWKGKGRRRNKVLYGQPGFHQPFPLKEKFVIIPHMEQGMHQLQTLLSVQYSGRNAQTPEIV